MQVLEQNFLRQHTSHDKLSEPNVRLNEGYILNG